MFIYVKASPWSDEPILVNINCRNEILLDYCQSVVLRDNVIDELKQREADASTRVALLQNSVEPALLEDEGDEVVTAEQKELAKWQTYRESLKSAISQMDNPNRHIDLVGGDDMSPLGLKMNPRGCAADSLENKASYQLAVKIGESEQLASVHSIASISSPEEAQAEDGAQE